MLINDREYFEVLDDIKARIKTAQYKAVLGVNREQILLYWNIEKVIAASTKYGKKFVENLAKDIRLGFPNVKGYSVRNLNYMRKVHEFLSDIEKVQTLSAQLSWSHNTLLLDKIKKPRYGMPNKLAEWVAEFEEARAGKTQGKNKKP
ncbi:MAG: DUF1016 N-terminal domain-containing protein [Kiritimatiellaeota bacterium]|nr:DUF1016 N-terminal domain-containing protein [Kiritimatiellota bacterium]